MVETPLLETSGIGNPSSNLVHCDHAQNPETLEEGVKRNIGDALNPKTLEKSSELEIEDATNPTKVIDKSSEIIFDDLQNIPEQSVEPHVFSSSDDYERDRERLDIVTVPPLMWYPSSKFHREEPCDCGSPFCESRFREFHHSSNVQPFGMGGCECDDPHCGNRNPFPMDRNPMFMRKCNDDDDNNPFSVRRGEFPGFPRKNPKGSPFRTRRWMTSEPCSAVGAGLANMGNTCFLNSIMQCFTHTVPFVQGLLSLKHESSSHGENELCVLCAVRDQIEHSIAYCGKVILPSNLVNNLSYISSSFRRYQQEDAQEFLHSLVDKLESNWSNYEVNANDRPSSSPSSSSSSSSSDDSLVKQVFGGRLVSQVRCCECGHISDSYEAMIDLSLEIEDVGDLESALKSFTKVESIEDFGCQGCERKVRVEKQLKLDKTPSIAPLHLKRFKSDGICVEKVDRMVAYPLELDLEPYSKGNEDENEELKYDLFALVVHNGRSYSSGHYFCYIRSAPDEWYLFDDSDVCRVPEERALSQEAYILFYARKGTAWFSSLIDNWKAKTTGKNISADTSPKSVFDQTAHPSSSGQQLPENNEPSGGLISLFNEVKTKALDSPVEASRPSCAPFSSEPCPQHDDISIVYENANGSEEGPAGTSYCYHLQFAHLQDQEKLSSSPSSSSSSLSSRKRKEAVKYVKSKSMSMPAGRRQLLMVALLGSRNETCLNKRKRKKQSSLLRARNFPRKRVKVSPKRLPRPVLA